MAGAVQGTGGPDGEVFAARVHHFVTELPTCRPDIGAEIAVLHANGVGKKRRGPGL